MGGGEWCVDMYRSGSCWLARAYPVGEHPGKPGLGLAYRKNREGKGYGTNDHENGLWTLDSGR